MLVAHLPSIHRLCIYSLPPIAAATVIAYCFYLLLLPLLNLVTQSRTNARSHTHTNDAGGVD